MTDYKPLGNEQLEKIRKLYVESFPEKIDVIEGFLRSIKDEKNLHSVFSDFKNEVHKLAGSSGSHGFDHVYTTARSVEKNLAELIEDKIQWPQTREQILDQISILKKLLEEGMLKYKFQSSSPAVSDHINNQLLHRKLPIFLISESKTELKLLSDILENRSFVVFAFEDLNAAQQKSTQINPAIIVLEIDDDLNLLEDGKLIAEFSTHTELAPAIVIISRRDDLDSRMKASQLGIDAFFASPINAHNFISTLDVLLAFRERKQGRVMLVDDDQSRINFISDVFKRNNIECSSVNEAENIADALVNFKPDLILISLEKCVNRQGNVAKMIRSHEYYFNIPIICILNESDDSRNTAWLDLGVDDCINEDKLNEERLTALKQKIVRFRRANHLIIMDSLTGTLNRDAFIDRSNEEISLAKRRNENICLAMIDIDNFKQINDANGHAVGDYVLRHLSDYLSNRLRRSDVVGRYGGDEFLVFLPDTDLNSAYLV
ncbi:MAG: diguanylate cyclase, partial [Pseudomonadota bacterium]